LRLNPELNKQYDLDDLDFRDAVHHYAKQFVVEDALKDYEYVEDAFGNVYGKAITISDIKIDEEVLNKYLTHLNNMMNSKYNVELLEELEKERQRLHTELKINIQKNNPNLTDQQIFEMADQIPAEFFGEDFDQFMYEVHSLSVIGNYEEHKKKVEDYEYRLNRGELKVDEKLLTDYVNAVKNVEKASDDEFEKFDQLRSDKHIELVMWIIENNEALYNELIGEDSPYQHIYDAVLTEPLRDAVHGYALQFIKDIKSKIIINAGKKEICIDFDGTLAVDNYPYTGSKDLIEENVKILKELKEDGWKIVIFTARGKEDRDKIKKLLDKNEVPYDKITNEKSSTALVFLDDRAVNVPYNGKWGKAILKKINKIVEDHKKVKSSRQDAFSFIESLIKNQEFPKVNWKKFWKEFYKYKKIIEKVEKGLSDDYERETQHEYLSELLGVGTSKATAGNIEWLMTLLEEHGLLSQLDMADYSDFGEIPDVNHAVRLAITGMIEEEYVKASSTMVEVTKPLMVHYWGENPEPDPDDPYDIEDVILYKELPVGTKIKITENYGNYEIFDIDNHDYYFLYKVIDEGKKNLEDKTTWLEEIQSNVKASDMPGQGYWVKPDSSYIKLGKWGKDDHRAWIYDNAEELSQYFTDEQMDMVNNKKIKLYDNKMYYALADVIAEMLKDGWIAVRLSDMNYWGVNYYGNRKDAIEKIKPLMGDIGKSGDSIIMDSYNLQDLTLNKSYNTTWDKIFGSKIKAEMIAGWFITPKGEVIEVGDVHAEWVLEAENMEYVEPYLSNKDIEVYEKYDMYEASPFDILDRMVVGGWARIRKWSYGTNVMFSSKTDFDALDKFLENELEDDKPVTLGKLTAVNKIEEKTYEGKDVKVWGVKDMFEQPASNLRYVYAAVGSAYWIAPDGTDFNIRNEGVPETHSWWIDENLDIVKKYTQIGSTTSETFNNMIRDGWIRFWFYEETANIECKAGVDLTKAEELITEYAPKDFIVMDYGDKLIYNTWDEFKDNDFRIDLSIKTLNKKGVNSSEVNIEELDKLVEEKYPNVTLWTTYHPSTKAITVNKILVPKEERQQGIGTQVMDLVLDYAKEHGLVVTLTPSGDFGGNKKKLQKWYKGMGFKKNKYPEHSETMIKESTQVKDVTGYKVDEYVKMFDNGELKIDMDLLKKYADIVLGGWSTKDWQKFEDEREQVHIELCSDTWEKNNLYIDDENDDAWEEDERAFRDAIHKIAVTTFNKDVVEANIKHSICAEEKYGCLMVELPIEIAERIRNFAKQTIKDEDLYVEEKGFGRENEIHATVLYGLKEHNADEILGLVNPVNIKFGNLSRFSDDQKPYDVIIIEVESEDLHKLHKNVSDKFEHITTYKDYKPHITLAYVTKEACKELDGKPGSVVLPEAGMGVEPDTEFILNDFYYINPKDERFDIKANMMSTEVYDGSEEDNTAQEHYFRWNIDNVMQYLKPKKNKKKKKKDKLSQLESKTTKEKIKELLKDDTLVKDIADLSVEETGDGSIKEDKPLKRQYIGDENRILKDKPKEDTSNSLNDRIKDIDVKKFIWKW